MTEVFYYPFKPESSERKDVDGVLCYLYLAENIYWQTINRLAERIDPFDCVIVYNLQGAKMIAMDLKAAWETDHRDLSQTIFHEVEYKSSSVNASSGYVRVDNPVDPKIIQGRRVVTVEDIGDTNSVIARIVQDMKPAKTVETAVAIVKMPHTRQSPFHYDYTGVIIDNVWVGGWGTDFNTPEVPVDFPRRSRDLLVRITI